MNTELITQDLYIESQNVKKGDSIYPWCDSLNPKGNTFFTVFRIDVKKDGTVFFKLQTNNNSLIIFNYISKVGIKEKIFVNN